MSAPSTSSPLSCDSLRIICFTRFSNYVHTLPYLIVAQRRRRQLVQARNQVIQQHQVPVVQLVDQLLQQFHHSHRNQPAYFVLLLAVSTYYLQHLRVQVLPLIVVVHDLENCQDARGDPLIDKRQHWLILVHLRAVQTLRQRPAQFLELLRVQKLVLVKLAHRGDRLQDVPAKQ